MFYEGVTQVLIQQEYDCLLCIKISKQWNKQFLNLLAPELFFLILAHFIYKMWIKQEPNMLELWNKLHFEEEKTESIYHV